MATGAGSVSPVEEPESRGRGTFAALYHRDFALFWSGGIVSSTGDWMEQIAINWLVLDLTSSAFWVGFVNFCRFVPILIFSLIGGVVADRVDRRKMLILTQSIAMVVALIVAVLTETRLITVWMIFVLVAARGIVMAFNQPARQALIPDLVSKDDLMNATSLYFASQNITRIIGPSVAGIIIGWLGVSACFFLNGASFIAVIGALYAMRVTLAGTGRSQAGVLSNLREGLSYARSRSVVFSVLSIALIPLILGQPYQTLLPVFAKDVLGQGADGYGFLAAASGIGSLAGSLSLASLRNFQHKGVVLLGTAYGFGISLVLFAMSPWFALSLVLVALVGFANTTFMTTATTLLQELVPEELRGRIMSLLTLDKGLVPLGTLLSGAMASGFGAPLTLAFMGALCAALIVAVMFRLPQLKTVP